MNAAPLNDPLNISNKDQSIINVTSWRQWFTNLLYSTPAIFVGTAAPTTTPNKVGDIFCDTSAAKVYISTGKTSSTDWKVLN